MRISGIRAVGAVRSAAVMESPVVQRLNAVRRGLRKHGAVVLKDTELDREVIARLEKQFGKENVRVQRSDSIKVSVDNFKR